MYQYVLSDRNFEFGGIPFLFVHSVVAMAIYEVLASGLGHGVALFRRTITNYRDLVTMNFSANDGGKGRLDRLNISRNE